MRSIGGATATTAVGAGAAAAQDETETTTGEGTDGNATDGTETPDGGGQAEGGGTTHTVDMTDELIFDPDAITIAPGDTIVWENVGQIGHTCTAYEDEIPEEAEFFASGGIDDEQTARNAYPDQGNIAGGESFEHTFELEGEYGYFCIPHETVGMIASVTVQPGGAAEEGGGPQLPSIPDSAKTLGIISVSALLSVLALAYFFLKYGGDYGELD